ncbi:tyrosine-type recombinase/integrase [Iodidimonas gelatinilytica]|uniref:tyrosine-type recombinase/integrase n=1 Tax=Iodidimonas gelatinilytica TaxID=1236966 RepID=UPI001230410C
MRLSLNPKGRKQTKKFRPTIPIVPVFKPWLDRDGWLVEWRGRPVSSIKTAWRRARRELEFPEDWVPKTIRYTVASEMRRRGVDKWDLEGWLGHRNPSSTDIYASFDPEYLGTVTPALNDFLNEIATASKLPLHPSCTRDGGTITSCLIERKTNMLYSLQKMVGAARIELATPTMST